MHGGVFHSYEENVMPKSIPGFSTDFKPAKIETNAPKKQEPSAPLVSNQGGKGGMPQGGTKPSKV